MVALHNSKRDYALSHSTGGLLSRVVLATRLIWRCFPATETLPAVSEYSDRIEFNDAGPRPKISATSCVKPSLKKRRAVAGFNEIIAVHDPRSTLFAWIAAHRPPYFPSVHPSAAAFPGREKRPILRVEAGRRHMDGGRNLLP